MTYKPHSQIYQVYNAGVVEFYTKTIMKDRFNTPIRGQYSKDLVLRDWFRKLGITSEDTYHASADDKKLTRKIAIRGDIDVDVKWFASIDGKEYEIYRYYYAYKKNETEISLVEVAE